MHALETELSATGRRVTGDLQLTAEDDSTRFELTHTAAVDDTNWADFGCAGGSG